MGCTSNATPLNTFCKCSIDDAAVWNHARRRYFCCLCRNRVFAALKYREKPSANCRVFKATGNIGNFSLAVPPRDDDLVSIAVYDHVSVVRHDHDLPLALCLSRRLAEFLTRILRHYLSGHTEVRDLSLYLISQPQSLLVCLRQVWLLVEHWCSRRDSVRTTTERTCIELGIIVCLAHGAGQPVKHYPDIPNPRIRS